MIDRGAICAHGRGRLPARGARLETRGTVGFAWPFYLKLVDPLRSFARGSWEIELHMGRSPPRGQGIRRSARVAPPRRPPVTAPASRYREAPRAVIAHGSPPTSAAAQAGSSTDVAIRLNPGLRRTLAGVLYLLLPSGSGRSASIDSALSHQAHAPTGRLTRRGRGRARTGPTEVAGSAKKGRIDDIEQQRPVEHLAPAYRVTTQSAPSHEFRPMSRVADVDAATSGASTRRASKVWPTGSVRARPGAARRGPRHWFGDKKRQRNRKVRHGGRRRRPPPRAADRRTCPSGRRASDRALTMLLGSATVGRDRGTRCGRARAGRVRAASSSSRAAGPTCSRRRTRPGGSIVSQQGRPLSRLDVSPQLGGDAARTQSSLEQGQRGCIGRSTLRR